MKAIRVLLISCGVLSANILSAQQTTLTYTDHEPLGNMRTRFINDVFFPAIEKESDGRLKIDAHWNGELSISYDALKTVAGQGIADMAVVVPEYTPDKLPLHQIFKSFPAGPSGQKQIDFFHRVYAQVPVFTEELENTNVHNLFFCTGYPTAFFSAKPLGNLEDVKGEKWRTASFWHRDFLKNAGAVPVTIPWGSGVYAALRADTLDGVMVNVDSGYDIKLQEVAPNILISKELWLGHIYLLVMNKNTWDSLAPQDRQAIERAAATAYNALAQVMSDSFDAQIEELRKEGAKVRVLKSEEVKQWEAATRYKDLQSAWVSGQEAKSVENVGVTMEKVGAIMADAMK